MYNTNYYYHSYLVRNSPDLLLRVRHLNNPRIKVLSSVGTPRSTSFQLSVFPVFRILVTTNLTVSKHQIEKKNNHNNNQVLTTKMSFIRRLLAFLTCCRGLQLEQSADQPTSHPSQAVPSRGSMFYGVGTVIIVGGTFNMQSSKPCLFFVIFRWKNIQHRRLLT